MLGENALAMEAYDQAIAQAQENDYISDLAVANELAANFWLQQDKPHFAQVYLTAARYAYHRWGAMAKVECFDARYQPFHDNKTPGLNAGTTTRPTVQISALDFASVTKASLALSSERPESIAGNHAPNCD